MQFGNVTNMIIIKIWGERHFCLYTLIIQFNSKFGARNHTWHRVLIMRNKYEYNRILLWEISWASSGGCVISNTSLLSAVYGFIHISFLWMWSSLWEQYVWHPQPSVWRAELNNEGGCYFVQKISYRPKWKIERKYLNFVPGLERWLVFYHVFHSPDLSTPTFTYYVHATFPSQPQLKNILFHRRPKSTRVTNLLDLNLKKQFLS